MNPIRDNYKTTYISSATTTDVTSVAGILAYITVLETAAGAITIYDATSGNTTTTVGVMKASIAEGTYWFLRRQAQGIQVVTAGASKIVVGWSSVQ